MPDFSDIKEKYQKNQDINEAKKTTVTGLLLPQFAILSSFIHLQSRDVTAGR